MEFEFLSPLEEKWQPVSKPALIAWLACYGLFLLYAAKASELTAASLPAQNRFENRALRGGPDGLSI